MLHTFRVTSELLKVFSKLVWSKDQLIPGEGEVFGLSNMDCKGNLFFHRHLWLFRVIRVFGGNLAVNLMACPQELKLRLKKWEREFLKVHGRKATKVDT